MLSFQMNYISKICIYYIFYGDIGVWKKKRIKKDGDSGFLHVYLDWIVAYYESHIEPKYKPCAKRWAIEWMAYGLKRIKNLKHAHARSDLEQFKNCDQWN